LPPASACPVGASARIMILTAEFVSQSCNMTTKVDFRVLVCNMYAGAGVLPESVCRSFHAGI
jgi:hypothetical protein